MQSACDAAARLANKTAMKSLVYHPGVVAALSLYFTVVIGNAAYHFYHGWAHADAERSDAIAAAAACMQSSAILKRHTEQCKHDEADSQMSSSWFAWREVANKATLCPPVSCAFAMEEMTRSISYLGLMAVAAVATAALLFYVAVVLFGRLRQDVPEYRRNVNWHRVPLIEEVHDSTTEGNIDASGLRQRHHTF